MNLRLASLLALLLLAHGCGGTDDSPLVLYKPAGSLQCSQTQTTLARLNEELLALQALGVTVTASSCANDGAAHPAVCDADTGDLFAVTVSASSAVAAQQLGFRPATEFPSATPIACK
jgi:hypothetical protein